MQVNNKSSNNPSSVENPLRRKFIRRMMVGAVLAITPIDPVFFEPRRLDVTKNTVHMKYLPESLDGLRVVQLSDLHLSLCVPSSFIAKAVDLCNSLEPDLVVITGDFISHNAKNARPCAKLLRDLKAPMGTFSVLGNHDHWVDALRVIQSLEDEGISVLTNRNISVGDLRIAGIDDMWAGDHDVRSALTDIAMDSPLIVLSHSPLALPLFKDRECLILAGHTHGGHINVPFLTKHLVTLAKGGRYVAGWYESGKAKMYVNRGIGGTPIRFRARPEVSLFVLKSGESEI